MRQYKALYEGKTWTFEAEALYPAKEMAVAHFKPPKSKRHMVSVILNDVPLFNSNADFG
jgi:hypothetical protein